MHPSVSKDDLFRRLCENEIYCTSGVSCLPSTALSTMFNTSRYQVKKTLKQLIDDGLVASSSESLYNWQTERYHILRGYCVTQKATETAIYNEIESEYNDYLIKLCNGTLEAYNEETVSDI